MAEGILHQVYACRFPGWPRLTSKHKGSDRGEKSSSHIKLGTSFYGAEAGHCYVNK